MGQSVSGAVKPASRATVEGIVTKDPDSQPVKKALIELIAENQAEGGDYTALTAADGSFRIENILPGRYHLFAERSGFLDADKNRGRNEGRILALRAGQDLNDVHLHLQAAAVIRGRVTDEDGDPMANAEVSVSRQTFAGGHNRWEQQGSERTNDLGEYRIANLPAGNVYVSVTPPPDFKTLIEAAGVATAHPSAPDKPAASYQTTYYPGTVDRSHATAIELHAGDDYPVNFSLTPGPSLSIRGTVVNLPAKVSATIMLQTRDFSLVLNGTEMHSDGSFVIRDVSPGSYTILATVDGSSIPLTARQSVQVGASDVEGIRLTPQPGATLRGRLHLEGRGGSGFDTNQIFLALESVDGEQDGPITLNESFSNLTQVSPDGSFQWVDVPAGNYYVQVSARDNNSNDEWYVRSAVAGGRETNDAGFAVNGGTVEMEVIASANGGIVEGVVADHKGVPVANAVVVAVPEERMRKREDHFRKTVSDQSGHFSLRGMRPGEYSVLAWENVEGEAYYNPEFLKVYEGQGRTLRVSDGDRKTLQVEVIAEESAVSN